MNKIAIPPVITPTDSKYISRLRKDYPEFCDGKSDQQIANHYNPTNFKYVESTLWDNLGDAAHDYERLANAYLSSVRVLKSIANYTKDNDCKYWAREWLHLHGEKIENVNS